MPELNYADQVSGEVELWFKKTPTPEVRQLLSDITAYVRYATGVSVTEFDSEFPFKFGQIFGHFKEGQFVLKELNSIRSLQPGDLLMAGCQGRHPVMGVITAMRYQPGTVPEWCLRRAHLRGNWYAVDLGLLSVQ